MTTGSQEVVGTAIRQPGEDDISTGGNTVDAHASGGQPRPGEEERGAGGGIFQYIQWPRGEARSGRERNRGEKRRATSQHKVGTFKGAIRGNGKGV